MAAGLNTEETAWAQEIQAHLIEKITAETERIGSSIPFIPIAGHYKDLIMPGGLHWWCNGFWPGMLWQLYHAGGPDVLRTSAEGADQRLASALKDGPESFDHDVGFLYLLSSGAEYLVTGSKTARKVLIQAADILKGRFQEKGSHILAWNPGSAPGMDTRGLMIVDCMMNLSLLYRATELTGEESYRSVADRHAATTMRCLVREDGSAAHIAKIDPETGEFVGTLGGQGYGEGSSWARGQGWILYGFTNAYRHTGKKEYLETAEKSADYCIQCLDGNDDLAPVDFRSPDRRTRLDSSAGMIIASGLLELAGVLGDEEAFGQGGSSVSKSAEGGNGKADQYLQAAFRILKAHVDKFCNWDTETDGVVSGGSLRYHDDKLAGASLIYCDYFLTEAVLKLSGDYLEVW